MKDYENIQNFVRNEMSFDKSGHGYNHAFRVFVDAKKILQHEKADEKVVLTSALIHDCIDKKLFENVDEQIFKVKDFLKSENYTNEEIEEIIYIITHISWSHGKDNKLENINAVIVRDADRLDAIGAVGIVRTIEYGNSVGREFYEPDNIGKDGKFGKITTSTLSHFYEKLLLIKDSLCTSTAKKLAKKRHKFMEKFLEEFYDELS